MYKKRFTDDIYKTTQAHEPQESAQQTTRAARGIEKTQLRGARDVLRRPSGRNYEFAQNDRFLGPSSGTMTADQAIFSAIQATRNRSRDLENSNPHVKKFLIMARTNVIGAKALRFQSRAGDIINGELIPDKGARLMMERAYNEFSKKDFFSLDTRLDRRRFMQMALTRYLVDGECIIRRVRGADNKFLFACEIIDADQLDHRLNAPATGSRGRIVMGIELDKFSRPVNYYFKEKSTHLWGGIVSTPLPGDYTVIPAAEITHYYEPERPGQTRGVTYLAPSGMRAKLLDGLEQSILVGFRVAASKMGFFKVGEEYEGEEITPDDIPSEVAPGQLDILPQGLEFQEFNPGYPNADYDGIKKSVIKEVAAGCGISYPELGNDYGEVNYSAGQIAAQADALVWENMQSSLVEMVETPCFEDFLTVQLTFGLLPFRLERIKKFLEHRFQPPKKRTADPMKSVKSHEMQLSIYEADPYEIANANGQDLEEVLDNFERAIKEAESRGLAVPTAWKGGNEAPAEVQPEADDDENAPAKNSN